MKVLEWVHAGCPEGVSEDYSYKRTTYALNDRGLVTVDRRRGSWSAHVTDSGRYYLEHGEYRPDPSGLGSHPAAGEHRE
ncbi:MAG: hypothetical protein QOH40_1790 [Arthrobacter pascens]|nr:hypothetical protein [Arthrobacter pascens]